MPPDAEPRPQTSATGGRRSDAVAGILAILAAMALFVVSDTLAKLARASLPVGEVMALRGVLSTGATLLWVAWAGSFDRLWSAYSRAWWLRNIGEVGSAVTFLAALGHMPLANVTAITQATPLATTAAGALFLGERVGWRRWSATAVGFLGVLLIVRPGTDQFSWWSLVALATVACVTVRDIGTRRMDRTIPPSLMTFVSSALVMAMGFAMGLAETWTVPTMTAWAQLAGSACFVVGGIYFTIMAVRRAELSRIAPFRYSIILWSILLGWSVWGDIPDPMTSAGIVIVVGAGLYTFLREQFLKRAGRL